MVRKIVSSVLRVLDSILSLNSIKPIHLSLPCFLRFSSRGPTADVLARAPRAGIEL
jgi:hypothetical protein